MVRQLVAQQMPPHAFGLVGTRLSVLRNLRNSRLLLMRANHSVLITARFLPGRKGLSLIGADTHNFAVIGFDTHLWIGASYLMLLMGMNGRTISSLKNGLLAKEACLFGICMNL